MLMHIDVIKLFLINEIQINDHIGRYNRLCKSQFEKPFRLNIHVTDAIMCGRQVNFYII